MAIRPSRSHTCRHAIRRTSLSHTSGSVFALNDPAVSTVDEYAQRLTPRQRDHFERVRGIVRRLVPDAEETISYGIPTFKHRGKYLIYFAAHKHHMSVYPTIGAVEPTTGTKGTFQFTEADPVPEDVILVRTGQRGSYLLRWAILTPSAHALPKSRMPRSTRPGASSASPNTAAANAREPRRAAGRRPSFRRAG